MGLAAARRLRSAGIDTPELDARLLLCHATSLSHEGLVASRDAELSADLLAGFGALIARRLAGEPVSRIVGKREFYGRDFEVGPDVLIPRPETETLVEAALSHIDRRAGDPPTVLDLGTGSGAIAVTLACERPDLRVVASDTSAAALDIARANARHHGCAERIEFLRGSWYEAVPGRRFDLVVANPPYVAAGDAHLAQGDLRFEPGSALTDGSADGLDSIRAIVAGAGEHLAQGGALLFEHGYDQAQAVAALLAAAGFQDRVSIPDLAGIPRVAGGTIRGSQ
jgi:release factor glutamine methyltransferase